MRVADIDYLVTQLTCNVPSRYFSASSLWLSAIDACFEWALSFFVFIFSFFFFRFFFSFFFFPYLEREIIIDITWNDDIQESLMRNIEPISLLEPNIISKERDFEDDEIRIQSIFKYILKNWWRKRFFIIIIF